MFTRQKYLLAFLFASEGKSSVINLTKGLFWLGEKVLKKKIYDFHPYHYGPFSELLYLDLRVLNNKGFISLNDKDITVKINIEDRKKVLENKSITNDFYSITQVVSEFENLSFREVLEKVYPEFPYFAINNKEYSIDYKEYDPRTYKKNQGAKIFSSGYEGVSIDEFINRMIINNINILVDVRHNPRSMKYGYSEKKFKDILSKRGIKYLSFKNLGIESENRQELNTLDDYKKLFKVFEKQHMPNTKNDLTKLKQLLNEGNRISLLCFEKDIQCCHREVVARHLYHFCNEKYELRHL